MEELQFTCKMYKTIILNVNRYSHRNLVKIFYLPSNNVLKLGAMYRIPVEDIEDCIISMRVLNLNNK